jgi:hypothetical protein
MASMYSDYAVIPMPLLVAQSGGMESHLDPRLLIGPWLGDLIVVSAIPHATLLQTWAVTGRQDDGTFATWTIHLGALEEVPRVLGSLYGIPSMVDALGDMLPRARS